MTQDYFAERARPYHPDIQRAVDLITMKSDTKAVGSFRFMAFKYPSDVDIMERVTIRATDKKAACEIIARRIRQMILRLRLTSPRIYLADFKAGRDKRISAPWLLIRNLKLQYGDATTPITQQTVQALRPLFEEAIKEKAITREEMKSLLKLSAPELYTAIRGRYLLRWTTDELSSNPPSKTLPGGQVVLLQDALCEKARLCKIDVWAPVQDGFIEVENVLEFSYQSTEGSGSEPISRLFWTDYTTTMCHEVRKFYRLGSYLKVAKRLWFLSKEIVENNSYPQTLRTAAMEYIELISSSPMLTGEVARLALGSSKLKCVKHMISGSHCISIKSFPIKRILTQLMTGMDYLWNSEMKGKDEVEEALNELYDVAFGALSKKQQGCTDDLKIPVTKKSLSQLAESIDKTTDRADHLVNKASHLWIKDHLPNLFTFLKDAEAMISSSF